MRLGARLATEIKSQLLCQLSYAPFVEEPSLRVHSLKRVRHYAEQKLERRK